MVPCGQDDRLAVGNSMQPSPNARYPCPHRQASDPMEEIEKFATKLERTGERVFKFACNTELKLGGDDSKVIAGLLLVRTLSNFRGTVILLRADRIVEARTIARCCFENLFNIAALRKDGQRFVSEMCKDRRASQKSRP